MPDAPENDQHLLTAEWSAIGSEVSDAQRADRMGAELGAAFQRLHDVRRGVSVFGSARLGDGTAAYATAREIGRRLAVAGSTTITGGGPGVMEGANRGAQDGDGLSVGLLIDLPFEAGGGNPYLDRAIDFHYFFARKVAFVRYSKAFVAVAGGYGTLDEITEVLCLVQTGKIEPRPVLLVGTDFWSGFADWVRDRLTAEGVISPDDPGLLRVTDDLDEVDAVCAAAVGRGDPAQAG